MSKLAQKIKLWYEAGNWTLAQVQAALAKGAITQEEYAEITGDE